jgi:hypothetical protein
VSYSSTPLCRSAGCWPELPTQTSRSVEPILRRRLEPVVRCNSRSAGKCDAAPSAPDTAGTSLWSQPGEHHACAALRCGSWNVCVLDSAWRYVGLLFPVSCPLSRSPGDFLRPDDIPETED